MAILRPVGFLMLRTVSTVGIFALASTLATRHGAVAGAAHQICFQIWLSSSLLADALAVAAQSLIATALADHEPHVARHVAHVVVHYALVLGALLAVGLHVGFGFGFGFGGEPSMLSDASSSSSLSSRPIMRTNPRLAWFTSDPGVANTVGQVSLTLTLTLTLTT